MKKGIKGWLVIIGVALAFYITAMYFIIPKAAAISLPFRWNRVPLDQRRPFVLSYFGRPVDSTTETLTDKWVAARDNGQYVLKVHYTEDSMANGYKLYFDFNLYFFKKEYLLDEK